MNNLDRINGQILKKVQSLKIDPGRNRKYEQTSMELKP